MSSKRVFITAEKCNGCRDCELACAAYQTGTLRLLKRHPDGKLHHPKIKLSVNDPVPGSLIKIIQIKNGSLTEPYNLSSEICRPLSNIYHLKSVIYWPSLCLHCDDAPCLDACISGAMNRNKKTGLVSVNEEQCVGCWSCLMVCPFGVIKRAQKTITHHLSLITHHFSLHASTSGVAQKCDGCPDLAEPACVKFCQPKALVFCSPQKFTGRSRKETVKRKVG